MLRLHEPLLTRLNDWIEDQKDHPSRPEAIRRIVERALASRHTAHPSTKKAAARKALDLAAREGERVTDSSLPPGEQARRKRTLIRGPKEFRDLRSDLPSKRSR
jgi:hypothetical protein